MGDDLTLDQRDAVRTPMQWDATPNGGFTTSKRPVHPVIDDGPFGYEHVNVERQKRDANSLLRWTANMIALRKETPEIGWGTWKILETGSPHVLAMQYDWREESVVVVHNFAAKPKEISIAVEGRLADLRVEAESKPN